jgi:hypothetical protein
VTQTKKSPITDNEILELFYVRLAGARKAIPVALNEKKHAMHMRRALAASGITKAVAEDVLNVPADWWWCDELRVWLPPVEKLPPGLMSVFADA